MKADDNSCMNNKKRNFGTEKNAFCARADNKTKMSIRDDKNFALLNLCNIFYGVLATLFCQLIKSERIFCKCQKPKSLISTLPKTMNRRNVCSRQKKIFLSKLITMTYDVAHNQPVFYPPKMSSQRRIPPSSSQNFNGAFLGSNFVVKQRRSKTFSPSLNEETKKS